MSKKEKKKQIKLDAYKHYIIKCDAEIKKHLFELDELNLRKKVARQSILELTDKI